MRLTITIALMFATSVTTSATEVPMPMERPPPDPINGGHSRETFTYIGVDKNGDHILLGRTIRTYEPDRRTFENEVAESEKSQQTIHSHISEIVVIDEVSDRPPIIRRTHPADEAGRREREVQTEHDADQNDYER